MLSFESFEELLSKDYKEQFTLHNNDKFIIIDLEHNKIYSLIKFLKENNKLQVNQLIDITAIDYPSDQLRFQMIYIFLSLTLNQRFLIKSSIKEGQAIKSITSLFKSANWYERECYDLFGIEFFDHPDLRRIMTDYNFEGHPLRKDFPLTGHNEVRYDDLEKKVVYEPVNLSQEYRNFDYSSPWEGLTNKLVGDEKAEEDDDK
tara:strand:+ start:522 stop:1130 length:609 start_codon:yes stop_codon:yes gene_type:complete